MQRRSRLFWVASEPYVYLLGMYLGDGYIARSRRGVWRLRIIMDARYSQIIEECGPPRYVFSNRSEDIKALLCEALDMLGIPWTRSSEKHISIYRRAAVLRVDRFVGPKY